jgi:dephospho-CoA kinase
VGNIKKKPIIGILGGIGSGKSTVAAEFAKLGCKVIYADKIAHKLLLKKAVREKIVDLFSQAILNPAGKIDHKKLAEVVFTNAEKLSTLNKIIHPFVLEQTEELIKQYNLQSRVKAIVLDMPLLMEVGWAGRCDKLIFVDCKKKIRMDRAKKKYGLDEKQIKIRENFQISLDNKAHLADNVINNNSGFQALVGQVADIFTDIVNN